MRGICRICSDFFKLRVRQRFSISSRRYVGAKSLRILNVCDVHLSPTFQVGINTTLLNLFHTWALGALHYSPLLDQCRSIVYYAAPTLIYHQVWCILCATTWHSTNTVSMLTDSLGRWPVIETALGDLVPCFLTAALCWWCFNTHGPETPDNTIHVHWLSDYVMLGHNLWCWANIIPTKTLYAPNHKYNREYYYFWTLVNDKST